MQATIQQSAAQALIASFPHLTPVSAKVDGLQAAAKNIRAELKAAFPGIKFSVKSSRFSMGDSIYVSWVDGPNVAQVEEITAKYKAGAFNSMEDTYDSSMDAWNAAFGDAKYINTCRDNSPKAIESAIRSTLAKYGKPDGVEEVTVEAFTAGRLWNVGGCGCFDLQSLIHQTASRRTWALAKRAI